MSLAALTGPVAVAPGGRKEQGMIILAGILIGSGLGWYNARKRGGNRLDQAQYAAVGALIGMVLGLAGSIIVERMI